MLVPLNFAGRSKPLPYNVSTQFLLLDKFEFIELFECVMIIVGTGVLDCPKNEYQIIN